MIASSKIFSETGFGLLSYKRCHKIPLLYVAISGLKYMLDVFFVARKTSLTDSAYELIV